MIAAELSPREGEFASVLLCQPYAVSGAAMSPRALYIQLGSALLRFGDRYLTQLDAFFVITAVVITLVDLASAHLTPRTDGRHTEKTCRNLAGLLACPLSHFLLAAEG